MDTNWIISQMSKAHETTDFAHLPVSPDNYLSTGAATLNVTLTNNPHCGYEKGRYHLYVGDSDSGKSYQMMCLLAEACRNPAFDDYTLIHDDSEKGMLMDVKELFGSAVAKRVRAAGYRDGVPHPSVYVEQMYMRFKKHMERGPCIFISDSMDVLTTKAEAKKTAQIEEDMEAERDGKGSMSDGKAKLNSSYLRQLIAPMYESGSMLFLITQTRDNIGPGFAEKTRSGGRAIKFYACTETWTAPVGAIKKKVRGKDRKIGNNIGFKLKKNRQTGRVWDTSIPLITGYGFDDITACIRFLLENKHWVKSGTKVKAPEFDFVGPMSKLISIMENDADELERMYDIVGEVWQDIISQLIGTRKSKYE